MNDLFLYLFLPFLGEMSNLQQNFTSGRANRQTTWQVIEEGYIGDAVGCDTANTA
jgi:hypothetical protein